jgi:hypothetical protein
VGIREEKLESIFEAFAQVQTGQVTGTGLGLFGVRRRAEGLQGSCGARHNLQSSTGTGTVIWFSIPYAIDRTESLSGSCLDRPAPITLSTVRAKPGGSSLSVSPSALTGLIRERGLVAMVVEDTLSIRKLMERTLLQLGFEKVLSFENGSKGLDALTAGAVDIVLSDLQMPIMTGHEVGFPRKCAFSAATDFSSVTPYHCNRWWLASARLRRTPWPAVLATSAS